MKVVSSAPTRISLFGGGTDVNPYAEKYGGMCINLAINIRQRIEIDSEYKLLKEDSPKFFEAFVPKHIKVRHDFDGPIESGLGSSAALAVSLLGAYWYSLGVAYDRGNIAEAAWDIEVNKIGLFGGKQDQYCSVFGGANVMEFGKEVKVTPISKEIIDKIYPSLTLFYLGKNRKSADIQNGFKEPTADQIKALNGIKRMAREGLKAINDGNIQRIGYLLSKSWMLKKKSNKGVSNEFIDHVYERGISLGALGGKVLGAGGGGHFLFIVPPKVRKDFIRSMEFDGLKWVDFGIDWEGLKVE